MHYNYNCKESALDDGANFPAINGVVSNCLPIFNKCVSDSAPYNNIKASKWCNIREGW